MGKERTKVRLLLFVKSVFEDEGLLFFSLILRCCSLSVDNKIYVGTDLVTYGLLHVVNKKYLSYHNASYRVVLHWWPCGEEGHVRSNRCRI